MNTRSRLVAAHGLLAAFLVFATAGAVRADYYSWAGGYPYQGGNGSFDSPQWSNSTGVNLGPPGAGDFAFIPADSILSGSGSVGTLDAEASLGGGLNGSFTCDTLGSVLLTGGSLTAGTIMAVSGDSAEDIFVMGGSVTAGSADHLNAAISGGGSLVLKGSLPTGEGTIAGDGSLFEVDGALMNFNGSVESGGTLMAQSIQSNNGLDAMITADGAMSLVTTTGNMEFDGQGLRLTNGGQAIIGGDLNLYPDPTNVSGGGSASADGAGTAVNVAGNVQLGPGRASGAGTNRIGTITVSDGASFQADSLIADSPGNGGTVALTNGATMQLHEGLAIGADFAGSLSIESGSGLTVTTGAVEFGLNSTGSGSGKVSGSGSYLNTSGTEVAIGRAAGSQGDLRLDTSATMQIGGGGAATSTAFLHVGDGGTGSLEISSGATVQLLGAQTTFEVGSVADSVGSASVGSPNGLTLGGPAVIGHQGQGTLSIGDAGTTASASGDFFVGGDGSGTASTGNGLVTVSGGAQFTTNGGAGSHIGLGNGSGSHGEIYVSGAGSSLTLNGTPIAGVSGTGQFAADQGAIGQSAGLELGASTGAVGSLLVYDNGTTWTDTNTIYVGGMLGTKGGKGFVVVEAGALVRVYHILTISNTGLVSLNQAPGAGGPFPNPAPPASASPFGRVFIGKDNFGPVGTIRVGNGGVLSGKGKQVGTKVIHVNVVGNVAIGLGGKFRPGGDPDVFSIEGDCDLSDGGKAGGETDIEVAGPGTAGTDYDQIISTGQVTLGGTLKLVLMEGYQPKAGDTIEPIKAKTTSGNFAEVVAPGLTLSPEFKGGKLSVKVMSVADVPAPMITSNKTATAQVGEAFSYQIVATGLPAGYAAAGLPTGLDIDPGTGLISGTPTTAGTSSVTLSSTSVGGTGKETLQLNVAGPVSTSPAITLSETSIEAIPDAAFSYQIVASNSPTSYAATGLPIGLSVNTATGVISGKPTTDGNYMVTLSATNATGTGTAKLQLVVALPAVKVVATVPEIAVGSGKDGEFTLSIPAALKTPLTIHYKISGSAVAGKDYVALKDTAVIKAGETTKVIEVVPRGDLDGALDKVVKLTLVKAAGYTLHPPEHAKVKIVAGQ